MRMRSEDQKKEYHNQYYQNNKAKIKERSREQHLDNRGQRIKTMKQYDKDNIGTRKQYYQDNKEHLSLCEKNRRKTDPVFAIKKRLRGRLINALKSYSKNSKGKSSDEYGINYREIIEHLKPFPENRGLYHIDHIKPLCAFDLNNLEEVKKAFAPENHQWLLASENMSKGGRYNV